MRNSGSFFKDRMGMPPSEYKRIYQTRLSIFDKFYKSDKYLKKREIPSCIMEMI